MNTPTKKQLVVRSLRALHKERVGILFKVKAIQRARRVLDIDEARAERKLKAIEGKLDWELKTNSETLNG